MSKNRRGNHYVKRTRRIRNLPRNGKGINTILAALLMVVIVVVASVMVYAWSTGLLGSLLTQPNVAKEALTMDSYGFASNTNVTINIRNVGSVTSSLVSYYVKDIQGDSWQLQTWTPAGQPFSPSTVLSVNIAIGSGAGGCGASCQYTGNPGTFNSFATGNSYTVSVVTTRNNQFSFTINK